MSKTGARPEAAARTLRDLLRPSLPEVEIALVGMDEHWSLHATHAGRAVNVACVWHKTPAHRAYVATLSEGLHAITAGRTRDAEQVAACARAWLVERRDQAAITEAFDFIDGKRRRLQQLATRLGASVRVAIEEDNGCELWAYGEGRSCRLDPREEGGTDCAFLAGVSEVARAALDDTSLGAAVDAWAGARCSLAELATRVAGLALSPGAEMLARGELTAWHWSQVLDEARSGSPPLSYYRPLVERMAQNGTIARFFSFTSMETFCFSYCSHFRFVTDGLPSLWPQQRGDYEIQLGDQRWIGDVDATVTKLEALLGAAPRAPFEGTATLAALPLVNDELTRLGSALRATRWQVRGWYAIAVEAGDRRCVLHEAHVDFVETDSPPGRGRYADVPSAIAAVRRWLEERTDVPFDAIPRGFDLR
jgi:hypothetical protein